MYSQRAARTDTTMSGDDNSKMDVDEDAPAVDEEFAPLDPFIALCELKFSLTLPLELCSSAEKKGVVEQMMTEIKSKNMAPFYIHLCSTMGEFFKEDMALTASMVESNVKETKELEDKLDDAKKNHGDIEILEAKMANAAFLSRIGDKAKGIAAYEDCFEKVVGAGGRIDLVFTLIRIALAWSDSELLKKWLTKATTLVDKEGDWERRNKLGVYKAVNFILNRDFNSASKLLLDSIATFTCTELFSYERFVFYVSTCAMVGTDRVTLKEKVLKSPDILQVLDESNILRKFMSSFHRCDYAEFFRNLSTITDMVAKDKYFCTHGAFYLKETRIRGYQQFLQSYKSVTMGSMAQAFGVSLDFLDKELSRFIAANRIVAKIDKVSSVVETAHADVRNEMYLNILKEGDILLNRVQKLNQKIRNA